jgi:hypothetical protein
VFTKDGKSYTKEGTGREFIFNFEELLKRMSPTIPGMPISAAQFAQLADACRNLERLDKATDKLITLTVPA